MIQTLYARSKETEKKDPKFKDDMAVDARTCRRLCLLSSARKRSVLWKKYFKYNIVRFVIEYKLKMLYSDYYRS